MTYVAANIYSMPFPPSAFDTVVMVRVLHHLGDVPRAFQAIQYVLRSNGSFVLEYASKRNIKAIGRYLLKRQTENPFDLKPWEFQPLHFDFHPRYVMQQLRVAALTPRRTLPVSHFRVPLLKRLFAPETLAAIDGWLQPLTAPLPLSPSVFTLSSKEGTVAPLSEPLFRCPQCRGARLMPHADILRCLDCSARYDMSGGIYDFRQALDSAR
jgi:SAM-dependent methyltransferase